MAPRSFPPGARFLTATDGTRVGYLTLGHGVVTVILSGGDGVDLANLITELLAVGSVVLVGRRGAGADDWGGAIGRWRDDALVLLEILRRVGATNVLAFAAGAHVALQAMLLSAGAVCRVILFEPPTLGDVDYSGVAVPILVLARAGLPGFRLRGGCELVVSCPRVSLITVSAGADDRLPTTARAVLMFVRHGG